MPANPLVVGDSAQLPLQLLGLEKLLALNRAFQRYGLLARFRRGLPWRKESLSCFLLFEPELRW